MPRRPAADKETPAQRDARMKWWREARFGMFIHWGVYSVPAGTYHGKQIARHRRVDHEHAARFPWPSTGQFAKQFNPVKFNADEWVRIAKDAGMKYIVITSKHHDGFAMFDSKASDWNIVKATPFERDPLKELAAACQQAGHQARLLLLAGPGLEPSRRRRRRRPLGQGPGRRAWTTTSTRSPCRRCARSSPTTARSPSSGGTRPMDMTTAARREAPAAAQAPAGHHQQQPAGRRLPGRHRNARAAHPRHRLSRAATGKPA